jgi:hypothetical protein
LYWRLELESSEISENGRRVLWKALRSVRASCWRSRRSRLGHSVEASSAADGEKRDLHNPSALRLHVVLKRLAHSDAVDVMLLVPPVSKVL